MDEITRTMLMGAAGATAVGFISSSWGDTNSTAATSVVAPRPANMQPGDQLVAYLLLNGSSGSYTPPAGWFSYSGNNATPYPFNFWKTATASEPATYTFSFSTARTIGVIILCFRNAGYINGTAFATGVNVNSLTTGSLPMSDPGYLIGFAGSIRRVTTHSPPAGMELIASGAPNTNENLGPSLSIFCEKRGAGASGARTFLSSETATQAASLLYLKALS
ncbi:hypothetical protein [Sphingobium cloacae]|uniref:Uncharacterized protein n=1 Tax=Sphingobium cloacae TaxID=120107 RepID=A0A1E1F5F8_9SPHN|nr:hypothetical protein [Sphingobium cloacae]BAV65756.1 hypothetical protein SCLO_1027160 [Sphingobium cloacae]